MTTNEEPVTIARPALLGSAVAFIGAMTAAAFAPVAASAAMADPMARKSGVVVIATLKAKPGQEAALHDLFLSLVGPARQDPTNISYDLVVAADDPATYVSIEEWTTPEALAAHLKTPIITDAIGKLGPIVAGPPTIVSYKMVSTPA